MIDGIIIKGIAGFYYVKTTEGVVECRARGNFREENITPLVGDKVRIRISDEDNSGYIEEIYTRKSQLVRPTVANITQAIIVMSIKKPDISTWLLDRFLIMAEHENLEIIICLNKVDLAEDKAIDMEKRYEAAGYKVIKTSTKTKVGIEELKELLNNNISVFAGPSGAGKSSLLNIINSNFKLETGDVSSKTKRGKHTTRHVELLDLHENTFVLDSPGFSSLNVDFIEAEIELRDYFREIKKYGEKCRFISCLHLNEPDCAVKEQVERGNINKDRYENYLLFLEEIKNIRRY
ncbi:ribosome small subunit-dependent GTPase A [Tissierella sp.]|uniref:ribosome small subunit-dependent GTPase A n=1 Tax=Tissierella sp. TaxID=41274 RepID=UPI0028641012|nr:ribosome small subunit-dependent GTPase A [Tissierella sp.]MDR7856384.1 ribosome small subunit-dependent GTPase A [Tissierella sp.]